MNTYHQILYEEFETIKNKTLDFIIVYLFNAFTIIVYLFNAFTLFSIKIKVVNVILIKIASGDGGIFFLCVEGFSKMKLDNSYSAPIDDTVKRSKKKAVEDQINSMIQPPGRLVTEHPVLKNENYSLT